MDIHLGPGVITLVLALLGNTCALVWGAAKLSGSVDQLEALAKEIHEQVTRHETRITVLEDREEREARR